MTDETIVRAHTSYQSFNDRFLSYPPSLTSSSIDEQPYNRQYSNVYKARLDALKPKCRLTFENQRKQCNDNKCSDSETLIVDRIIELKEETKSFMVGTIIKVCPKKPKLNFDTNQLYHESGLSYLGTPYEDDDNNNMETDPPLANTTFCNVANDTVLLEDESGRIELSFGSNGKMSQKWKLDLATGTIMGVKGIIHPNSSFFDVEDIYYPTLAPHRTITNPEVDEDACVLLMSGLDCGGHDNSKRNSSTSLKRELIIDYITGYINNTTSESIARVIIAGGGCAKPAKPENAVNSWISSSMSTSKKNQDVQQSKNMLQQQMKEMTLPIRELDLFLSEICSCGVPVDYIPGLYDPTNANWPQRPIHECLVPNANVFTNMLCRTPNPYEASIGDKVFIGSDGLNIFDLRCNLGRMNDNSDDPDDVVAVTTVDALQSSLKFNHLVPTGPDTVPTFPFDKSDPFIIEHSPHVYFCGNCEAFETKLIDVDVSSESGADCGVSQVRLICVPSFAKTGQVVLLKLKSMECSIIEFDDIVTESNLEGVDDVHDEKKIE